MWLYFVVISLWLFFAFIFVVIFFCYIFVVMYVVIFYVCVWLYSAVCDQPREPGPCKGYFASWYYDKTTGYCAEFVYGGCEGNENRFSTELTCRQTCNATQQIGTLFCFNLLCSIQSYAHAVCVKNSVDIREIVRFCWYIEVIIVFISMFIDKQRVH